MQSFFQMVVGVLLLAVLAGCGQAPETGGSTSSPSPDTSASPANGGNGVAACSDPNIRGTITNVAATDNGITISIDGQLEEDTDYDRAVVTINQDTQITRQNGEPVTMDDLQNGIQVEACFTGPVAESYPVQARASGVVILD